MKTPHWIGAVLLVLVSYYIGTKYPNLLTSLKSTVTGS